MISHKDRSELRLCHNNKKIDAGHNIKCDQCKLYISTRRARYRGLYSHGIMTSGNPIFLATIVFPTMRWGYDSLTCFRSPSSNLTDTHIPASNDSETCLKG